MLTDYIQLSQNKKIGKNKMNNNFQTLENWGHWKNNVLAIRKQIFDKKLLILDST